MASRTLDAAALIEDLADDRQAGPVDLATLRALLGYMNADKAPTIDALAQLVQHPVDDVLVALRWLESHGYLDRVVAVAPHLDGLMGR